MVSAGVERLAHECASSGASRPACFHEEDSGGPSGGDPRFCSPCDLRIHGLKEQHGAEDEKGHDDQYIESRARYMGRPGSWSAADSRLVVDKLEKPAQALEVPSSCHGNRGKTAKAPIRTNRTEDNETASRLREHFAPLSA